MSERGWNRLRLALLVGSPWLGLCAIILWRPTLFALASPPSEWPRHGTVAFAAAVGVAAGITLSPGPRWVQVAMAAVLFIFVWWGLTFLYMGTDALMVIRTMPR